MCGVRVAGIGALLDAKNCPSVGMKGCARCALIFVPRVVEVLLLVVAYDPTAVLLNLLQVLGRYLVRQVESCTCKPSHMCMRWFSVLSCFSRFLRLVYGLWYPRGFLAKAVSPCLCVGVQSAGDFLSVDGLSTESPSMGWVLNGHFYAKKDDAHRFPSSARAQLSSLSRACPWKRL